MGKDNSIPEKSTIRDQVDALNETLKKLGDNEAETKSLRNAIRLFAQKEQELKDMQRILKAFDSSPVTLKENKVLTEKRFNFNLEEHLNTSYEPSQQEPYVLKCASGTNRYSSNEALHDAINSHMLEYVQNILEQINQYTDLQFYCLSYVPVKVPGDFKLLDFTCTLDIK